MALVGADALALEQVQPSAPRVPRSRLRVALFLDSPLQPRWAADAIACLDRCDVAELVAVVDCGRKRQPSPRLWAAYAKLDHWAFGVRPDPLAQVDLREVLPRRRFVRGAGKAIPGELAGLEFDVAFAFGRCEDSALVPARYGVWRYFFGAGGDEDGALAGIAEVSGGAALARSGVKAKLHPAGPERIVYESWARVFRYSLARTRDCQLPKASEFAERALRRLHRGGEGWMESCPPLDAGVPRPARRPHTAERVKLVSAASLGTLRALRQRANIGQWFIAYRFGADARFPGGAWNGELDGFHCMVPPIDRFWADPFPLEREGRHYIFFEELEFRTGRGRIAAVEVRPDGERSQPVNVLERPYHLSYPLLLEQAGELYMVPETGDNRTVELYRCTRFPDRWELEKVLLEGRWFTDATLHRRDGRWWMFVNVMAPGTEGNDELHLYFAESLFGPWRAHPANPVKSDVRGARPAGLLYEAGGALYRPGQIGAPIYGSGVSIHRVLRLDEVGYAETEVHRVLPARPREVLGVHTLNSAGGLSVIDGFVRRPRFGGWKGALAPRRPGTASAARAVAGSEGSLRGD